MILLIHGNAGVGKTTIARMINEHMPQESIVLEVDKLRYNVVDERIDTEQLDLVDDEVLTAAEEFLDAHYDAVIIEGVYPSQNHLHKVVDRLRKIDSEVYVYRLDCSLRENIRRDENRPDELTVGKKVEEVFDTFDKLDHDKEIGEIVDTTALTPERTVEKIEMLMDGGKGRV